MGAPQPPQQMLRDGAAAATRSPWLRFAIVSVARKNDADYLLRALHSIVEQLPAQRAHPTSASTDVVVVNNHEPAHAHRVFHEAARRFARHATFVTKATLSPPLECPAGNRGGIRRERRLSASPVKPSVQQQSCDLVGAMHALLRVQPAAEHVMMLEDDWLLCPHGHRALSYAVDKAYLYDERWLALRVSYGFNGVVVPQADLASLAAHLQNHFHRRPPDHLLFEWFSGERDETRCEGTARAARAARAARLASSVHACTHAHHLAARILQPINFNVYRACASRVPRRHTLLC